MNTIAPLRDEAVHAALANSALPHLREILAQAGAHACLRVTALPEPVMELLAEALAGDPRWAIRVLAPSVKPGDPPWRATPSKIVELRNGSAAPLLVMKPQGLRVAAEDSIDVATFAEVRLEEEGVTLREELLQALPEELRSRIVTGLGRLREQRGTAARDLDEELRYLLLVRENGNTPEAAGGALFALGLVPDFEAFTGTGVESRLLQNAACAAVLEDATRPLQKRLIDLRLAPGDLTRELFLFLRERRELPVRAWGEQLASEARWRPLTFEHWKFSGEQTGEELHLLIEPLNLPLQARDEVGGAAQVKLLRGNAPLPVAFRSDPRPSEHATWATYRFQVVSLAGGEPTVVWESSAFKKPTGGARVMRRRLKPTGLEVGTYFVRVDAYTADGVLLTTVPERTEGSAASARENESEVFLYVEDEQPVVEETTRARPVPSLLEAWAETARRRLREKRRAELPDRSLITGGWTEPAGMTARGQVHFDLACEGTESFTVVMPAILRRLELEILAHPDRLGIYRLNLRRATRPWDVAPEATVDGVAVLDVWPEGREFLSRRQELFARLRDQHAERSREADAESKRSTDEIRSKRATVVETADLLPLADEIEGYAGSYARLVEVLLGASSAPGWGSAVAVLARLDTVELRWSPTELDPGRALLAAPTHPLRLLWHLQHSTAVIAAIETWSAGSARVPDWPSHLQTLLRGILPLNLPPVLFGARERAYVEHGPLTNCWGLYLPDGHEAGSVDPAVCHDRVTGMLAVQIRDVAPTLVGASEVSRRFVEYLGAHPYVEQLTVNIFNPGDAGLFADALRDLERRRREISSGEPPPLRYAVRLFSDGERPEAIGSEIDSLIDPERQVGEDDEFTLANGQYVRPKLVFAKNRIADFVNDPGAYRAHVSIVLEGFSARGRVADLGTFRCGSFFGGLIQEPESLYQAERPVFGWVKGLRPAHGPSPAPREALMARALGAVQRLQASAALGGPARADSGPVVALELGAEAQLLLRLVHESSDWVLTIDRNLGLDFFDSPSSAEDTGYLLDFAPEYLQEDRQRILLTTRSSQELHATIAPMLGRMGLDIREGEERAVLEAIRTLSGRLALRFTASNHEATEVTGLLLARWKLEQANLLSRVVVIPLDAHQGWFVTSGPAEEEAGVTAGSARRADLLLVAFDPSRRRLLFRIVEVKARTDIASSGLAQLYADMKEQTDRTAQRLRELFDPESFASADGAPRSDLPLRAKELATVLAFYVRRAQRYGLMSPEDGNAALRFLSTLEEGYRIDVSALGVVYQRSAQGSRVDELEPGFPVYRFGHDDAKTLLAAALRRPAERDASLSDRGDSGTGTGGGGPASPASTGSAGHAVSPTVPSPAAASARELSRIVDMAVPPRMDSVAEVSSQGGSIAIQEATAAAPSNTPEVSSSASLTSTPAEASAEPAALGGESASPRSERDVGSGTVAAQAAERDVIGRAAGPTRSELTSPAPSEVVFVGASEPTAQYGILGKLRDRPFALDLNGCNTISLFGVQGFGKSYTLGAIAEMASMPAPGINCLPAPLATVIFHYHKSDAYPPEYATARFPNTKEREIGRLADDYGAKPQGLTDVVLLSPEAKLQARRREFPGLEVRPIKFASCELGAESWKFLLGASDSQSLYMRQLVALMRQLRGRLTVPALREALEAADMQSAGRQLAQERLKMAEPYIDDSASLVTLLRPGRTVIVDLRDEWIEKEDALGLFVVMLRIFAAAKVGGHDFNKLVVFDEAHKYITESDLIGQVVETIREMRHQATSVVIASQDPLSVPRAVVELTSVLLLHRMTSPQWLKHLKSAIHALDPVSNDLVASLPPGEALLWAQRSSDRLLTQRPQRVQIRPRVTQHGGGTRTAVEGATVR